MGKVILYGIEGSPPVRATLLTLHALKLPFEFKRVMLLEKGPVYEELLRINPLATVPTLDDNGHIVTDSHAINAYLVNKYGESNDALYPKDLAKRSVVDQCLYYDTGVVFERAIRAITRPIFLENQKEISQLKINDIAVVYDTVNGFLKNKPYVAGDHLTIADFSLISSISSTQLYLHTDAIKYPNLTSWIKRMENLPYYEEANGKGVKQFFEMIRARNIKIVA